MYTAYELCSEAVRHTMTCTDYVMTISLIQPSALSHKPITNHREVTLETFHDYWMGSQFVLGLRREQKGAAVCSVWSSNEVNWTPYNYHHTSCTSAHTGEGFSMHAAWKSAKVMTFMLNEIT